MAEPVASPSLVRFERHGAVAVVTLDDPERRNALRPPLLDALIETMTELASDPGVRAVVLTGAGRVFAAGADLREIQASTVEGNLSYNRHIIKAFAAVGTMPMPTIAALNGHALGGGLELALACTLRVASSRATLGLPEVRLGLLPGAGGCQRLPRLIASGLAARMLLTGEAIGADRALEIGLVDEVAEGAEGALTAALKIADQIAANAPLSVRSILRVVRSSADVPVAAGLEVSQRELAGLLASRDLAEGIGAFLDKRPAEFVGA
jgi:enoyl-CoA hydratase/carnithine racemase